MNLPSLLLAVALAALLLYAFLRTRKKAKTGGGCCGEHEKTQKKVSVSDRNREHYPYKAALDIGGMTCENCARKVENALNRLEGVWAKVSISGHRAEVLSKTSPDEKLLRDAVRKAGYVVTDFREVG